MTIWNPKLEVYTGPRYKALAEAIANDIKAGVLKPRQKLPTHRDLAEMLGVTVGTITRGYAEAEKRELVVARMGSGTFVSEKTDGMSDYLDSSPNREDQIDMSLSITLDHGQEKDLGEILAELGRSPATMQSLVSYQFKAGTDQHRSAMSRWLSQFGVLVEKDQIVICNGGQNAINTVLQALTRSGDRVVSDMLTYPGFTYLAKHHRLRHFGVEMDDWGMIPEDLEDICQKHNPRLLYCMPNLQNPTSITLPLERRQQIVEIARKYDLYIIEDQVQGLFQFDPPPSLHSLAPERVFFNCSFSKIFAGGLRIGVVAAPKAFINNTISALYLDCLFAAPLMAEVVCQAIESGRLSRMTEVKRKEIGIRQQLVAEILSGLQYISHPESPHTWLTLPEPWDTNEFVLQLQKQGVLVKAENTFIVSPTSQSGGIRICLTAPRDRKQVEKGLQLIRDTIDQHPGVCQSIM